MKPYSRRPIYLSWSSGKDSAWSLHTLRQRQDVEVVGLLTTINEAAQRVAMHAVRETLLDAQAEAAGLPLIKVPIPYPCSNEAYEAAMTQALGEVRARGVDTMAFGDLFLEDIRQYREQRLAAAGFRALFPLWRANTFALARQMLEGGLRAHLTSVDPKQLPAAFCGRAFDHRLLGELPRGVDPCGENGEFHSFVWDGPMFRAPIAVRVGETVERDGFFYADVLSL
jgi:uncharacterized protein (TIGR00290 family)